MDFDQRRELGQRLVHVDHHHEHGFVDTKTA
jgi:hypothetical protein